MSRQSEDKPWEPLSFEGLKTTSLKDRQSKVKLDDFGRPWSPGGSFTGFLDSLPCILAGELLRDAVDALARAVRGRRTVLLGMGAHPSRSGSIQSWWTPWKAACSPGLHSTAPA